MTSWMWMMNQTSTAKISHSKSEGRRTRLLPVASRGGKRVVEPSFFLNLKNSNFMYKEKITINERLNEEWKPMTGKVTDRPREIVAQYFGGEDGINPNIAPVYYSGWVNLENKNGAKMRMVMEVGPNADASIWEVTTLLCDNEEGLVNAYKCVLVHQLSMLYFKSFSEAAAYARAALEVEYDWLWK